LHPFRFDRTLSFAADPPELWAAITRTDEFPRWWPWLRELSGDGLVPGGRSTCVVRAPVPYTLRFSVTVEELVPGRRVAAFVDGDLAGPAHLEVGAGTDGGSTVRLAWDLQLRRPMLQAAARIGRPVMEWGHDWVVTSGVEQFRRRALGVDVSHDNTSDDRGP
jgi:Polyketide cyclase / dehydrase and lipid transport